MFTHVAQCDVVAFPFKGWIIFHLCVYHFFFFSCLPDHEHLACFYPLAIINKSTMNMDIQISLLDPAFNYFGYIPRSDCC